MSVKRKNHIRKDNENKLAELEEANRKLNSDINELKKEVEFLITKNIFNDQLNELCDFLSLGYFIYNINDQVFINKSSLVKLIESCIPGEPVTVNSILNIAHPEDAEFIKEIFSPQNFQKKSVNGQIRLFQKIKESREIRYFSVNGIYSSGNNITTVFTGILRDITREVKQSKDYQRSIEKASEADRIKTMFLLNISHNIRTPMNSILGFAELLSLTDPGREKRKEYIKVIKNQSKSLLQLIDDVAELAKYESGSMTVTKTPVNLNHLINEVRLELESYRSIKNREQVNIEVKYRVPEGLEIYTDAGRLHQIISNLLKHSLKYTSNGTVSVGYNLPADNKLEIFVKDTSQGISKDEIKFLFDRFTQIEKNDFSRYEEDPGFGLTIARSAVKLLGGRINFETNEDNGIFFTVSLPFEAPPKIKHEEIGKEVEGEISFQSKYKWGNKLILIVEDEEVNGLFLEAVFQETGAQTIYAKNGKEAIDLCKSIIKISMVLMDIKMPVMSGIKATQEIRKFNKTLPIIAQTALASEEDKHHCMVAGCNDTITKPIDVEELLNLVSKYLSV
ncbi:MAG: response regulator [Bacteroidales bacterium]|nr:response regulator [Bacteroidales bacterium]